jgi:Phytanoyl-CoA dioxygenase (PhyH)
MSSVLSDKDIAAFIADGYVAVRGAMQPEVARACHDIIWSELESRGVRRDDQSTWTAPVVRVRCPEGGPFVDAGTAPPLREACDQLLWPGRWWRREGVGGSIPVRFPSEEGPGDAGWHIDSGYTAPDGSTRTNVRAPGGGLLALFLFSDVDDDSAPTRLRRGSHQDVARVLAPSGDEGLEQDEAMWRRIDEASAHRPTVLATGSAGDVYLCHQLLVHAASWPHRGRIPRVMAQPSVVLLGEYRLPGLPAASPSPAEQAILGCLTDVTS